jgi:hypothetical protein
VHPGGRGRGTPGPDQGYALRLARRFEERLHLGPGESAEDVLEGAALLGARRAALSGRAPCIHDLTVALTLFGFLGGAAAAAGQVAGRARLFRSVAHEYTAQRRLVDAVPEELLRLTPAEIDERTASGWRPPLWEAGGTAGGGADAASSPAPC